MKNIIKNLLSGIILMVVILNPFFVFAQQIPTGMEAVKGGLDHTSNAAGLSTVKEPQQMLTTILGYILGFLGVIIFINILFAGYQWMTAGGNEEAVTKAKTKIKNSIIGFIIILAAYIITSNIFILLKDVVTPAQ